MKYFGIVMMGMALGYQIAGVINQLPVSQIPFTIAFALLGSFIISSSY